MKVEIYSDVVCPWCYIGERRFERALEAFGRSDRTQVVFRPFQLDPEGPASPMPLLKYLTARYGSNVEAMVRQARSAAAAEGIPADWTRAIAANTRHAHRLLGLALRELGSAAQRELASRLFEAHFVEGRDISSLEQLVDLAADAGIDPDRARAYLESGEGSEELDSELAAARELGVRAVPTFLFERKFVLEGAQPVPSFLRAFEEVERSS